MACWPKWLCQWLQHTESVVLHHLSRGLLWLFFMSCSRTHAKHAKTKAELICDTRIHLTRKKHAEHAKHIQTIFETSYLNICKKMQTYANHSNLFKNMQTMQKMQTYTQTYSKISRIQIRHDFHTFSTINKPSTNHPFFQTFPGYPIALSGSDSVNVTWTRFLSQWCWRCGSLQIAPGFLIPKPLRTPERRSPWCLRAKTGGGNGNWKSLRVTTKKWCFSGKKNTSKT